MQFAIYSNAVASYTFPTDASFTSVQNIHLNWAIQINWQKEQAD